MILAMVLHVSITVAKTDQKNYGDVLVDRVNKVTDGDTIVVTIKAWPHIIGEKIPVRISEIDTPELNGNCKEEVQKARLAKILTETLVVRATIVQLVAIQRDKYFRVLAEVWADGKNVGQELIEAGLARPYRGGRRIPWCD